MNYSAEQIASFLGGTHKSSGTELSIQHILTDSRKLLFAENSLFFALQGPNYDGHKFVEGLYQKGTIAFVISDKGILVENFPEAHFYLVEDTLATLQRFAIRHREQFKFPVIGITGSNGKTTVKEWLFRLLQDDYRIVRNPGSFNSQIGVPLSVVQMDDRHELGIFEAGISAIDEMEKLSDIIQCDTGIFLNIGAAHDQGFADRQEKLKEKFQLFRYAKQLIYCADQEDVHRLAAGMDCQKLNWGINPDLTPFLNIKKLETISGGKTRIEAECRNTAYTFEIPFAESANIENCIHCITLMLHLGYEQTVINNRLAGLHTLPLRLEVKQGVRNMLLVNDAYSNDPESLQAALQFLQQQAGNRKKGLILSDFKQSNENMAMTYRSIASLIEKYHISLFVGLGKFWSGLEQELNGEVHFSVFENMQMLEQHVAELPLDNMALLIKGAREYRLERLADRLTAVRHRTRLEIDLGKLATNIRVFRKSIKPETRLMVVLKAAAYGSGDVEMVQFFEDMGVDYIAVAYMDEGVKLRESGMQLPIMVLNPDTNDLDRMIKYRLEPEIYSLEQLDRILAGWPHDRELPCHIKLDTGMHRLGFRQDDLPDFMERLRSDERLVIRSIFSHLVASEDPEMDDFTRQQYRLFSEMYELLNGQLGYSPMRHLLNSSGISRFPEFQLDMVRLGIGMYGFGPEPEPDIPLQKVHTLKAVVSQIKRLKKGDTVGYGGKFRLPGDTTVATLTIGYADGLMRQAGNGRYQVLLNGKPATILGSVCMDMCMVDISDIRDVHVGDEAEIFGTQLSAEGLAKVCGTIVHEVLARISSRVSRVYVRDF